MTYYDLLTEIKRLSLTEQLRLLAEVSQSLATGAAPDSSKQLGFGPEDLLALAGTLPAEDAAQMRAAIEAGCEQVKANEW